MPIFLRDLLAWANANQGTLAIVLFLVTLALGWISGIFAYLRHKPAFRIRIIDGPTFFCTFGTGQTHRGYDVHRTGIALYLGISNVGSSPASIDAIAIGYRWAIRPFNRLWWRYGLRRFWLSEQAVVLDDFQVAIGDNLKVYPFLVQRSTMLGSSSETFLDIGRSTNGVVYFEQNDSFSACFPVAYDHVADMKVVITDSFGGKHSRRIDVPRRSLAAAREYNPSFGMTLRTMRGEDEPIDLPVDAHGNLVPPS